jgi:hypothetical protein
MVTRMHILLEPNMDTGTVALFEAKRFLCGGDAATDLAPGKYQLVVDFARKDWKIVSVGARSKKENIRFTVDLDGPDPFTLGYANPCALEITNVQTADSYVPDPFIDMLPDVGPKAFRDDPDYVDTGLVAGEFDIASGSFTLRYENGETFELTNHVLWADLVDQVKPSPGATIYTYCRLKPPGPNKILPRRFDSNSAPNIAFMIQWPGRRPFRAVYKYGRSLLRSDSITVFVVRHAGATTKRNW